MPLIKLYRPVRRGQGDMLFPAPVFHPQFVLCRGSQDVLPEVVTVDNLGVFSIVQGMGDIWSYHRIF
jgi:hypothetical protein